MSVHAKARKPHPRHAILRLLGPGLVAGAADDDPSGVATYSQAGAQFGYGLLWTVIITYPFMVAIQVVSARIGRATGKGVVANMRGVFPAWAMAWIVILMLAANTINIAADLAAMGSALALVIGGKGALYALLLGAACVALEVLAPYRRYAPFLKGLTMVLFFYVGTVLTIRVPWAQVAWGALWPHYALDRDAIVTVVAVFGTTISPYVFFWQAAEEVEDMKLARATRALRDYHASTKPVLRRIGIDTAVGMGFSNVIAACIIVTTAATLHAEGVTQIDTSAQAAEALRPLAGDLTFLLFALGILGTGLLAVPVLAGSAAYAVAEAFDWRSSLELKPLEARGFYAIIAGSTLIGAVIGLSPLDPIKMLFWSAVINGVVAAPVMAVMMRIASSRKAMGPAVAGPALRVGGWAATAVMALVVVAMLASWAA
ncbi:iron transporter [Alsobacter soli]|uniref:Iron transporter n=1 Tax=Alsobacter soli TaxID=2109933 RepID=A0A2T1HU55_9HYPH|nr:divalent metal cation transporter [Alsobacter soli]PSC05069.1 iron transporter [Alsobacter soli]